MNLLQGRQKWKDQLPILLLSSSLSIISYEESYQDFGAHSLEVWFLLINSDFLEPGSANGLLLTLWSEQTGGYFCKCI